MENAETTFEQRMLNDTLGAFNENHIATLSPETGILLLEGWLNALRGDVGAERIMAEIEALRDHLKSGQFDNGKIQHLLLSMASHTRTLSHEPGIDTATAAQLEQLATTLRNFSNQF